MRKMLLFALCAVLILSACSTAAPSSSTAVPITSGSTATSQEAPAEVKTWTIMKPYNTTQPPVTDGPIQLALEEALNIKLDVRYVPTGTFTEVFNTTLSTKDVPKVIYVPSSLPTNPAFIKYCSSGVFHELNALIDERPALFDEGLTAMNSLTTCAVNDKFYFLANAIAAARVGVVYREDWRVKVGAPVPNSVENFYEMARMFTELDPDGNGKDDTFGFSYVDDGDKELAYAGFTSLAVAHGAPNLWGNVDGKITPYFETPEYMQTLNYFKDMYDKGYMNNDFYMLNNKTAQIIAGECGMMMTSATNAATPGGKLDPIIETTPGAALGYINLFTDPNGNQVINSLVSLGAIGGPAFPKSSTTEEEVGEFLDLIIKTATTPELDKIDKMGIEGRHYTVENGTIVMTDAQMTLRQDEAGGGICPSRIIEKDYGQVLTPIDRIRHELFACEEFAVEDSSAGKMTGELLQKSTSIATIISDARVKYIVGEIDEAGFLAAVQAWKDAGGKDIIDSLNA